MRYVLAKIRPYDIENDGEILHIDSERWFVCIDDSLGIVSGVSFEVGFDFLTFTCTMEEFNSRVESYVEVEV